MSATDLTPAEETATSTVRLALLALTMGGFGIGLTEFVIAGLLPEVARSFSVSEARAGGLVSGYALAVAIGAVVLTAAVTRLDRKTVLIGLLVLFVAGNLINAIAPTYAVMLLGRVVAALCHGAFFGIGSVTAANLVPPGRRAAAVATMFAGLTTANVLGVPLGTLIGQQLGWRATFWVITGIGLIALAGVALLVPSTPADPDARIGREVAAFRAPQVWASLAITTLGFGGMFGAFTYIAYTVTEVSGFSAGAVSWLLVLFGIGLFAGNQVGGRAADRNLQRTLALALAALTVVMVLFALSAHSRPATIVLIAAMGLAGFATVPALQLRIMVFAPTAPTLAAGANIGAFNLGNAIGAWLGGLTISAGLGYTSPLWVGAAMVAAGLIVCVTADRAAR